MSIRSCVARAFGVIVTAGVAAPDPARAGEEDHLPGAGTGFLLARLSKGHVRTWRAIEQVGTPSASPRS